MAEQIRLLACAHCKTIEQLPDYDGPAEYDTLLERLLEKHGPKDNRHIGQLFRVEADQWRNEEVKQTVTKQISEKLGGGETGLGSAFYNLKDTYAADAMACWKSHMRNPACNEYKSDSKRLTPGTAAERKAAGLPPYRSPKDRYLCDFCPVQSLVEQAARAKAGMYSG